MNVLSGARIAIRALRVNKLRSALTMLGIVIGVGAVITMVSVGAGAQARVAEQIASLGSNMIIILSGSVTQGGVRIGSGSQLTITDDDAWAIQREIPLIEAAAPSVRGSGQVVYGNLNWGTTLQGITPEYFTAREWGVMEGRLLTQEDVDGARQGRPARANREPEPLRRRRPAGPGHPDQEGAVHRRRRPRQERARTPGDRTRTTPS